MISIHAARVGSDVAAGDLHVKAFKISIHAARVGSDFIVKLLVLLA